MCVASTLPLPTTDRVASVEERARSFVVVVVVVVVCFFAPFFRTRYTISGGKGGMLAV